MDSVRTCFFLWDLRDIVNSTDKSQFTDSLEGLHIASLVISVITCILGLVGNSVVIWVTGFKMKNGKAMTWFLNLAVADLVFLLCLPMNAISLFTGQWYFGDFVCKIYQFLSNINMYASIFILTVLTVDRCLSVALPLWHRTFVSKHFFRWACLVIWILTIAMSIPSLCFGHLKVIDKRTQCIFAFNRNDPFNFSNIVLTSNVCLNKMNAKDLSNINNMMLAFPIAIENGFPEKIFENMPSRRDCQHEEHRNFFDICVNKVELKKWNDMLTFSEGLVIPLLVFGFLIPLVTITLTNIITVIQGQRALSKPSSKLFKLIIIMVVTYFFAWTPLAVVQTIFIIAAHQFDLKLMRMMNRVLPLVSSISSFHSCLNPILYVLLSRTVRKNMTESLNSVWSSLSSRSAVKTQCSPSN